MPVEKELEPYEPQGALQPIGHEIWIVEGPVIGFRWLGLRLPFTTRMTIVRLADGGLWVHSPIELGADLAAAVDALGPVRHLVAPNRIHYWWLPAGSGAIRGVGLASPTTRAGRYAMASASTAAWARSRRSPGRGRSSSSWSGAGTSPRPSSFTPPRARSSSPTSSRASRPIGSRAPSSAFSAAPRALFIRRQDAARPEDDLPRQGRGGARGRAPHDRMAPERIVIAHGRWYRENAEAELRRAFRWAGPLEP